MPSGCYSCEQEKSLRTAADAERVWVGAHWRVAHAVGCALRGWLVVVPRRHTTTLAEHTAEEAAELGPLIVAASSALQSVTGCTKTYVAQFAESVGFSHTHFHVLPRYRDAPAEMTGPGVFGYLGRPPDEHVPADVRDDLAREMRPLIAEAMVRLRVGGGAPGGSGARLL